MIADFLVEIQSFDLLEKELIVLLKERIKWTLNLNGASNRERARIGVILESSSRVIEEAFRLEGQMTNNEAEYEALLYDLELALKLGIQNLKVYVDS